MRRVVVVGMVTVGLLVGKLAIGVLKNSDAIATASQSKPEDPMQTYWLDAQRLTKDQFQILDRIASELPKANAQRLKLLRGQVFLQSSAIDRFLKANYPDPKLICTQHPELGIVPGTDAVSVEQLQVYCSLYASTQDLTALRVRLASLEEAQTRSRQAVRPAPQRVIKVANSTRIRTKPAPVTAPATPKEVLALVESSQLKLAQAQTAFPRLMRLPRAESLSPSELPALSVKQPVRSVTPSTSAERSPARTDALNR